MSRPLRIGIFLTSFPVISETFILRQITGLLDRGHEVRIFADYAGDNSSPQQPEMAAYRLLDRTTYLPIPPEASPWEMPVRPLLGQTWLPGSAQPLSNFRRVTRALPFLCRAASRAPQLTKEVLAPEHYGYQAQSLSALYRLSGLLDQRQRFDLLHAHFGPAGNSYRFAARLLKAPMVVSFHGYDVPAREHSAVHRYARLFAESAALTANSEFMRQGLIDLGCPSEKLSKIPYGIDLAKFDFAVRARAATDPVHVLTVGRLVEKKGIEYSLRAFAKVQGRHPAMVYHIVGDGPLGPRLRELARELGVERQVTFHGTQDSAAISQLLALSHVFMLASVTAANGDREGTPVSLLEAQASGLPVLATRHAGIPEIVPDGQSGFLVAERDVADLADRLEWLAATPAACSEMGRLGREFVSRHFTEAIAMNQLLELYERLARDFRARHPEV